MEEATRLSRLCLCVEVSDIFCVVLDIRRREIIMSPFITCDVHASYNVIIMSCNYIAPTTVANITTTYARTNTQINKLITFLDELL